MHRKRRPTQAVNKHKHTERVSTLKQYDNNNTYRGDIPGYEYKDGMYWRVQERYDRDDGQRIERDGGGKCEGKVRVHWVEKDILAEVKLADGVDIDGTVLGVVDCGKYARVLVQGSSGGVVGVVTTDGKEVLASVDTGVKVNPYCRVFTDNGVFVIVRHSGECVYISAQGSVLQSAPSEFTPPPKFHQTGDHTAKIGTFSLHSPNTILQGLSTPTLYAYIDNKCLLSIGILSDRKIIGRASVVSGDRIIGGGKGGIWVDGNKGIRWIGVGSDGEGQENEVMVGEDKGTVYKVTNTMSTPLFRIADPIITSGEYTFTSHSLPTSSSRCIVSVSTLYPQPHTLLILN